MGDQDRDEILDDGLQQCQGMTEHDERCQHRVRAEYCPQHAYQAPGADPEDALTRRQKLFIEFYFANGFNQARAAIQAGYSERCARSIGSNLMADPRIKAVVEARLADHAMSANETIARLTEWGRGTIDHFLDDGGNLDLESDRAKSHRHLIKKVHYDRYGRPEAVDLHDPQSAVSLLAKVHGVVKDRVEHSGSVETISRPAYDYSVLSDEELEQLDQIMAKLEESTKGKGPEGAG